MFTVCCGGNHAAFARALPAEVAAPTAPRVALAAVAPTDPRFVGSEGVVSRRRGEEM